MPDTSRNVRGDTDHSPQRTVVPPATSCICNPYEDVFCDTAGKLTVLIRRGERIKNQFGDQLPLNLAVGKLADHLRVDLTAVLDGLKTTSTGKTLSNFRKVGGGGGFVCFSTVAASTNASTFGGQDADDEQRQLLVCERQPCMDGFRVGLRLRHRTSPEKG